MLSQVWTQPMAEIAAYVTIVHGLRDRRFRVYFHRFRMLEPRYFDSGAFFWFNGNA